jgi:hypothetical protein
MGAQQLLASYGGAPASAYAALNPSDKAANVALSGSNLVATGSAASAGIVRSVQTITGKKYFEMVFTANGTGSGALIAAGVANGSHTLTASLGFTNANGWGFWGNSGFGARHNSVTAISSSSVAGDVFGFAVDVPNTRMWIRKNGTWLQGDPATNTSPIWTNLSGTLYAAACPWNVSSVVTARFDPATFGNSAPSGFDPMTA